MTAKPNVCQHAKRGICPSCADPMRATPSSEVNRTTDFGKALLAALPSRPSKRRRNRRRHHASVNGPIAGRCYDVVVITDDYTNPTNG